MGGACGTMRSAPVAAAGAVEPQAPPKIPPSPVPVSEGSYHDAETRATVPLSNFACFVPGLAVEALLLHRDADFPPTASFRGAFLFADASGFTALTQELQASGNGADQMCSILNAFFDVVIRCVIEYGGDVVKFSGDALSICWRAEDDGEGALAEAAARAGAASLAVHEAIRSPRHGTADTTLKMHMGLGAGELTSMHVGGVFGRWEFVVSGPPVAQISVAEPLAASEETVASPEAWALLEGLGAAEGAPCEARPEYVRLRACRAPATPVPGLRCGSITGADVDLLCRYIPGAVHKRLRAGGDQLAEMRTVSTLFVNIMGVDLQADDVAQKAQVLMTGLQRVVYQHDGSVNKFLIDDKGMLLIAAFGLPPLQSSDDAVHAVATAFDVVSTLRHLDVGGRVRGRVGIATGPVFCGVVGSEQRREYTVMGSCVNLSARLMAQADAEADGIIVDGATQKAATSAYMFDELPSVHLKGFDEPVALWAPVTKRRKLGRPPRRESQLFNSRTTEIATMNNTVRRMAEQGGGVILLTGARGSGKKAMVSELVKAGKAACLEVVRKSRDAESNKFTSKVAQRSTASTNRRGSLNHIFSRPTFCAWREVVARLLGQHQIATAEGLSEGDRLVMQSHLLSLIPDESLHKFAGLFGHWMPGAEEAEVPPEVDDLPIDEKEQRMVDFMLSLLQTLMARGSKMLVFPIKLPKGLHPEEVYDPLSWTLLAKVVAHIDQRVAEHRRGDVLHTPFILAISARLAHAAPPEGLLAATDVAKMHDGLLALKPLSQRARRAHLRDCLRVQSGEVPEPLERAVFERAGGNPEHIAIVADALREEGFFSPSEGGGPVALLRPAEELERAPCPEKVLDAVRELLDMLDAEAQIVVQTASCFSPLFSKGTLALALETHDENWPLDRLARVIHRLVDCELVEVIDQRDVHEQIPRWFTPDADDEHAYRFCSNFVRRLLFKRLPEPRRAHLAEVLANHAGASTGLIAARSLPATPRVAPEDRGAVAASDTAGGARGGSRRGRVG